MAHDRIALPHDGRSTGANPPGKADLRESSDRYCRELIRSPCQTWRIIEGGFGVQWVLQRRTRAGRPDGGVWIGVHFFRQRETAARLWCTVAGQDGAAVLRLLPERFRARA